MTSDLHLLKQTKIYRNNQITIPFPFMLSEKLNAGDSVSIYTYNLDGKKALVIIPQASDSNIIQPDYKNLVNDEEKQIINQNN